MTEEPASPNITPTKHLWLIWIVPLVAFIVGGYLLYKEFATRGPVISVTFSDGTGLESEKTKVLSNGVKVGSVSAIRLSEDLEEVVVEIQLDRSAESMARENTRIWVVRPRLSSGGISGLDTIVSGAYIEISPGSGKPTRSFAGLDEQPLQMHNARQIVLHAHETGSIHPGVPIEYRGIEVGNVDSVALAPDASQVLITVDIDSQYQSLIRENTVFWDSGGVNMKVGLLGAKIRTGSLADVITGSIEFSTPPASAESPIAAEGSHFILHPEPKDSWLKWNTANELTTEPTPED